MKHLTDDAINEYLDHELAEFDRSSLELHLAECAECTSRLEVLQEVFAQLSKLPEASLSHDLSSGILRSLPQPHALPPLIRLAAPFQAVVALLGLAITIPYAYEKIASSMTGIEFGFSLQPWFDLQRMGLNWWIVIKDFHLPALTGFTGFEFSDQILYLGLLACSIAWFIGNGMLLKDTRRNHP
jgi:hypothetical protein